MSSADNAIERALRWLEEIRRRNSTVEPDWWLRMECGQVLNSPEPAGSQDEFDFEDTRRRRARHRLGS